jgi:hypothetical protein
MVTVRVSAAPAPAVTRPVASTVARLVLLLDQVTVSLAPAGEKLATESCWGGPPIR